VHPKSTTYWLLLLALLAGLFAPPASVQAYRPKADGVTAFDLIIAMNTLRASNGLPQLIEDPIIDSVAQSTAEIMAASQMSWHIGDVSGRVQAAGYGGGAKVWATENFAAGSTFSIDEIMLVWSDASHMIPALNPAYCNIGAGTAKSSSGLTYYVLQAAYTTAKACGEYKSPTGSTTNQTGGTTTEGRVPGVSQLIVPVKIAAPDAEGRIYHVVEAGQSFWSIAVAYKITIKDIESWNNLSKDSKLQIGQKLFIPGASTSGYATPTPAGMIQRATPGPDGRILHSVQPYQTLITIAQAYEVPVETILALNGIHAEWPLQIDQQLVIYPGDITPSPTSRPLSPIEKLTPAPDGKYYHPIQNGENLSSIANLYQVPLNDLMAWNNLTGATILQPQQKLLLQVTPPATPTYTESPPTATPTATKVRFSSTPSRTPPSPLPSPTPTAAQLPASPIGGDMLMWGGIIGLAVVGIFLVIFFSLKRR
jgi:LysM repeat protein